MESAVRLDSEGRNSNLLPLGPARRLNLYPVDMVQYRWRV